MLRSLVRPRPSWPGITGSRSAVQSHRVPAAAAPMKIAPVLQCQPLHSTAPSCVGFKNFKNSPRIKWRTQQELEAKDAEINTKRGPHVSYAEAVKSHKPRAWIGARKKVAWGRLFGPSNSSQES